MISPNQNIYIPDDNGYKGVDFNSPAFYAVSKAGIIHLTKYLATYWAHQGVRVNCLVPGAVLTTQSDHLIKNISYRVPLSRLAEKYEYTQEA